MHNQNLLTSPEKCKESKNDLFQIERTEYGDFYGNILAVSGQAVFEEKKNIQFVLKEEFQKATLLLKEKKKIDKIIDEVSYSIKKKKKLKKETQEPSKITQEIETLQKNIEIKLGFLRIKFIFAPHPIWLVKPNNIA